MKHILKNYNLPQIKAIKKMRCFGTNESYLVTTVKKKLFDVEIRRWILKKLRIEYTDSELLYQIDIMKHASKKGINVIFPIKNKRNEYFTRIDKDVFLIYPFVEKLDKTNVFTSDTLNSALDMFVMFHKSMMDFKSIHKPKTKAFFESYNDITKLYEQDEENPDREIIYKKISNKPDKDEFDKENLKRLDALKPVVYEVCKQLESMKQYQDYTIVHYDFQRSNLLFKKNQKRVFALLDFEFSHKSLIQLDVIKAAKFYSETNGSTTLDLKKFKKFIQGYIARNKIQIRPTDIYYSLLYLVLRRFVYGIEYYYHLGRDMKKLIEIDWSMLNFILEHKQDFITII